LKATVRRSSVYILFGEIHFPIICCK